jgi:hypothetical protein
LKIELKATKYGSLNHVSMESNLKINFPFSEVFLEHDGIELRFLKNLDLKLNINDDNIYIKPNEDNINKIKEYIHSNYFLDFVNKNYNLNIDKILISEINFSFNENIKNIEIMIVMSEKETDIVKKIKELEYKTFNFFFDKIKDCKNFSRSNSLNVSTYYLLNSIEEDKNQGSIFKSKIRVLKANIDFEDLKYIVDSYFSKFKKYRMNYNTTNEFHLFEIDFYANK